MRAFGRLTGDVDYTVFVRDAHSVAQLFPELANWSFRTVRPRSIYLRHPFGFPYALRRCPVDLLHAQYFIPPLCPCPAVLTVHDISFAARPEFFTLRDRLLLNALVPASLRRAARIITDAEFTRAEFVRIYGLDPARIEIIPLAADPRYVPQDREAWLRTINQRHGFAGPFILYVGTLQPRKNVQTLIEAYARMRRTGGPDHKLLIVGKLKYKFDPVFAAIERASLTDDVAFAGFVPEADLPGYYSAADLFVFPSRYEGFGLPVVEAMACGTPVITTTASSLPEVAGDAAILVGSEDVVAMSEAMGRVLANEGLRSQMSAAGLVRARCFSWERTARETLAVYQRVLHERE